MDPTPESSFQRFQQREARQAAAKAQRTKWLLRALIAGAFLAIGVMSAKDVAAAWTLVFSDPRGPIAALAHLPRPAWRGAAVLAAGALSLLCCGWLLLPVSRGRDPELALSLVMLSVLSVAEFKWLSAARLHFEIGVGIAVIAIVFALLPAPRKKRAR
jgi:hypothetical protein